MPYPKGLSLHTIWDDIALLIDSTKDLLSLALTCRTFKELIIPEHLEYRHIRSDIRYEKLWKLLASRPRLCRGIRSVELTVKRSLGNSCLPETLANGGFSDSYDMPITNGNIALFRSSISLMTLLKEFTWTQFPASFQNVIDLSDVLASSASRLEGLSIQAYIASTRSVNYLRYEKLAVWTLTSLKRVVIDSPNQGAIQMILSCPDIEDLCLWDFSFASHLMHNATWKRLRRLSLSINETPISSEEFSAVMTSFFHRHSNIECLSITVSDMPLLNLPSSCLPNLRSIMLRTNDNFLLSSLLSADGISRLMHLDLLYENGGLDTLPQMNNLHSFHITVIDNFSFDSFASFLRRTPNLQKVCLQYVFLPKFFLEEGAQGKLIKSFLQCPNLTHIFCHFPVTEVDLTGLKWESLEDLCQSLSSIPALTYIEVNLVDEITNVKLERDQNGCYSGYQFVTLKEAGGPPQYWTDVFIGLYHHRYL